MVLQNDHEFVRPHVTRVLDFFFVVELTFD